MTAKVMLIGDTKKDAKESDTKESDTKESDAKEKGAKENTIKNNIKKLSMYICVPVAQMVRATVL